VHRAPTRKFCRCFAAAFVASYGASRASSPLLSYRYHSIGPWDNDNSGVWSCLVLVSRSIIIQHNTYNIHKYLGTSLTWLHTLSPRTRKEEESMVYGTILKQYHTVKGRRSSVNSLLCWACLAFMSLKFN
jgi:hypothetical protein